MRNKLSFKNLFVGGGLLASMAVAHAQSLTINTFAGHDAPGSKDGLSSSARFRHPNSIAADSAGNIYVADTENSTIRKITPNGSVSTFAGFAGTFGSADGVGTNALFYAPQGIAVDSAGFIYVADTANATIRKITPAGVVSTLAGSAGNINSFDGTGINANFYQPRSLAVDNGGNVYVADTWNHTIRKITPAGLVSTLAGLAGNPGSADGTNSKARFNRPSGIAVDNATNLFVTDFHNHTIRKITPGGTVTTIAGLPGVWGNADGTNNVARFFQPQGIVADNAGNLFVADSGNQTIRKISPSGTNWIVSTVAGLSGIAGNANGTNNTARFYFPADVAQDIAGYIYVADLGNNAIRTERIVPPTLQLSRAANQFIFAWPVSASGFVLESAHNVSPGAQWIPQTNTVFISGDYFVATNNPAFAPAFHRLHRQ
ncbi:NHL repeat-containing protein [Pedosphaera parvula]|uniref:NHL repeat containing protein n=1 Tax=Pedosphaera parvula (strain Ellin514) TaxID=320771 RepID=B9XI26_PEDPL|nr:NHL repeat-containing protein [Pedosphaera parvula]EEF60519.1 NHL repeat containing protein [Pedosphaera parvula Ellin514]